MTESIAAPVPEVAPALHFPQPFPFFRRLFAFTIDGFLLGIVGQIGGLFLSPAFAALGPWGRVVGGVAGVLYFGIGNSRITGGRTVGKSLLNIAVRHVSGTPLSIPASFARAILLMLPITMNGATFMGESVAAQTIAGLIVFGLGGITLFLFLFNSTSMRQGVHDLVVRSVVVWTAIPHPAVVPRVAKKLVIIPIAIIALAGVALAFLGNRSSRAADFRSLRVAQRHVMEATGSPSVAVTQSITGTETRQQLSVAVTLYSAGTPEEQERLATEIAASRCGTFRAHVRNRRSSSGSRTATTFCSRKGGTRMSGCTRRRSGTSGSGCRQAEACPTSGVTAAIAAGTARSRRQGPVC